MRPLSESPLEETTRRLVSEFNPEEVLLFGSHAWGEPNEESDVDLLVIVSRSEQSSTQRATRAYRCLRGTMIPLDIIVKTREEVERLRSVRASLVRRILEEGKVLYASGKALART